ncbi:carboxyltransferase domain-containing protein [Brachybacterium sp. AOP43-C2-M15]|uniref:carboxyltransferase domain-containing protein n=1 Tax=Brachybacterium sp. AOP43-C2-M15 TaxID=3457661 RepID=UPI004033AD47
MSGNGEVARPTSTIPDTLDPPLAVHRAGETALLAEYPDTAAVLAVAAAVQALSPEHLVDLVPAERTLLLAGTAPQDLQDFTALLRELPVPDRQDSPGEEVTVDVVYDGEDLDVVAALLGMGTDALIDAHSAARWTAAFGGFAPGFAYLLAEDSAAPVGPPWDVPRRGEPRTAVPAGAVGLASRYCGIYPRPSPGGWQLIGRSDAVLFDVDREAPALLAPGTRVRFAPQRPTARAAAPTTALSRAARGAAAVPGRLGRRRPRSAQPVPGSPVLEVLSPGPRSVVEDDGRPGRAAIGVSRSGAFDRGAMLRANLAVGNPARSAVLETAIGPLRLRAMAPTVVAVSGARAPLVVHRHDEDGRDLELDAAEARERPIALDAGDLLDAGPATQGLHLVLAIRGGIRGVRAADGTGPAPDARVPGPGAGTGSAPADVGPSDGHQGGPVLGALSRDTLAALGPAPLRTGDVLLAGPSDGLDAVPAAVAPADSPGDSDAGVPVPPTAPTAGPAATAGPAGSAPALELPVILGPREELLGTEAVDALLATTWTVRSDSDRVGVRLEGQALPVPAETGSLPSEPMVPGAIQVPPSGLPVVFGPDHPTTGGYPVIAVLTRAGTDLLAQARPGTALRFLAEG